MQAAADNPTDTQAPHLILREEISSAVAWSMDPAKGSLQGPLDLGFFNGQTICLNLSTPQVALLVKEGRLSRLFLGGHHILPVGIGPDLFAPDQHLIFLDLEHPFRFSWTRSDALVWGNRIHRSLLGECSVTIKAPRAYFDTFLARNGNLDPAFVERLMAQVIRSTLIRLLETVLSSPSDLDFSEFQSQLVRLNPRNLTPSLDPCGLVCSGLSVYSPAQNAPFGLTLDDLCETAGLS